MFRGLSAFFSVSVLASLLFSGPAFGQATNVQCNGCVGTGDLANGAVATAKLKNGAVATGKLKNDAVSTAKIKNGAVSTAKIRNGAVTRFKVAPELARSLNTACPDGESVYGMDNAGNFLCEPVSVNNTLRVTALDSNVQTASCPVGEVLTGVGCLCDDENTTRNLGILFSCDMIGNSGFAGCYYEPSTFDAQKDDPIARLTLSCTQQSGVAAAATASAASAGDEWSELEIARQKAVTAIQAQKDRLAAQ